jgi:hypothetical protein
LDDGGHSPHQFGEPVSLSPVCIPSCFRRHRLWQAIWLSDERGLEDGSGRRNLDPTRIPDACFVNHANFADNALLKKLRDEYRAAHPHKTSKKGITRRLRRNPKPASASPVNTKATSKREPASPTIPFSIDGFRKTVLHDIVFEAARTMRAQGASDDEIVTVLRFVASEIETYYGSDATE